jgi:ABC-type Fe3+/spermidine/putrescine transport system ATPase subunit
MTRPWCDAARTTRPPPGGSPRTCSRCPIRRRRFSLPPTDIAMVFQSYALYPHMTVRENMGFALKLAKTPQATIDEKVNEAARILDLTQHLERKPANLSGGQRQGVAMGRAIVRDPSAFLMDEPLSNLDAKLRVQMRTEVSRIQRRLGTTMVYVTHDQTEAMTLGPHGITFRADIDVVESMGSDVYVYFAKELESGVDAAELKELAADSGRADTGQSGDTVVARIDAATRVREGQEAELWVDVRSIHVFDPATGLNLTGGSGADDARSTGGSAANTAASGSPPAASDTVVGDTVVGDTAVGDTAVGGAATGDGSAAGGGTAPGQ